MFKKFLTATVAASIALMAAPAVRAQQAEETSISLPALSLGFTPTYVADAKGFWTKRGLNVTLHQITGIGSMNAVLAGSVDFTNSSGPTVIRALIRGQKSLSIGSTYDGLPFEILVAPEVMKKAGITESSPIEKKAQALKGLKVSVTSPNTIPHVYLRYFARRGGVDPERDIQVVSIPPEAGIASLKNGTTEGYVQGPPWPQIAQHRGVGVLLASALRGDLPELNPLTYNVVATRPDFCDKKPTVCQRLMDGYLDAMNFQLDHPDETLAILEKKMPGADPAALKESLVLLAKGTPRTTKINLKGMANAQTLSIQGGMIKADEKLASFDALFTNKFAK
jgi:ABC-type nitrate/sulfonate/bicarbonate transport system substrate-binding protein